MKVPEVRGMTKVYAGLALHLVADGAYYLGGNALGYDVLPATNESLLIYLPSQMPAFYLIGTGVWEEIRRQNWHKTRGMLSTAIGASYHAFLRRDGETAKQILEDGRKYFE